MGAAKYLECFAAFLMAFVALVLFLVSSPRTEVRSCQAQTLVRINSLRAEALRTDRDLHYS